jgi:aspartyl-tRNA(Asn)/glutamyl-tRNA(Gln) amidotransferase subunit A
MLCPSLEDAMAADDICALTLEQLGAALRRRELSPVHATRAVLQRIEALNPKINAFTTLCAEQALIAAKAAEEEIQRGFYRGPLHGIPVGVKDLYDTAGVRTTYGSGMFRTHLPDRDAAVVSRLKAAGAVIVGKTATHELGLGLTTNNFFFGPTRNPWNLDHVPGGSSGGSAAAIAADMCFATTGSDGGGSIRFPCAWCGVTGIKPTLGLVSNRGEFGTHGSSFAVPGPICKTLRDAALLLQVLVGFDAEYPWSVEVEAPHYLSSFDQAISGLRVGISDDFFVGPIDPQVRCAYEAVLKSLEAEGVRLVELRFPHQYVLLPTLFATMGGEAAATMRSQQGKRTPEFGPETLPLIEMALNFSIDDYTAAQTSRELLRRDYRQAFRQVDAIVLPTAPLPAPRIGEELISVGGEEHLIAQLCANYTAAANLTGLPAVPVPAGVSSAGLPIGVQVMAGAFDEVRALRIANAIIESAPELRRLRSPLAASPLAA